MPSLHNEPTAGGGPETSGAPLHNVSPYDVRAESAPGAPRWVKVFGIVFVVLILTFVILHLTGNSFGFGDHMSSIQHWLQQLWH